MTDSGAEPVSLVPLAQAWEAVYGGEPGCPDEAADRSAPDPSPTDLNATASSPALCAVVTVTGASLGEATIATSLVSTDESRLTYAVGVGACDQPPEPLVYESDELIVVGGATTLEPGTDFCTDQLLLAEVTVSLDAPIDNRPVLATTGQVLTFGWW